MESCLCASEVEGTAQELATLRVKRHVLNERLQKTIVERTIWEKMVRGARKELEEVREGDEEYKEAEKMFRGPLRRWLRRGEEQTERHIDVPTELFPTGSDFAPDVDLSPSVLPMSPPAMGMREQNAMRHGQGHAAQQQPSELSAAAGAVFPRGVGRMNFAAPREPGECYLPHKPRTPPTPVSQRVLARDRNIKGQAFGTTQRFHHYPKGTEERQNEKSSLPGLNAAQLALAQRRALVEQYARESEGWNDRFSIDTERCDWLRVRTSVHRHSCAEAVNLKLKQDSMRTNPDILRQPFSIAGSGGAQTHRAPNAVRKKDSEHGSQTSRSYKREKAKKPRQPNAGHLPRLVNPRAGGASREFVRHFNVAQRGGMYPSPPMRAYAPLSKKQKMAGLGLLPTSAHLEYAATPTRKDRGGLGMGLQAYLTQLPEERYKPSGLQDVFDDPSNGDGGAVGEANGGKVSARALNANRTATPPPTHAMRTSSKLSRLPSVEFITESVGE